ncbi:MAG: hypothetical protein QNJ81_07315 [Acidimicrobiia bacterium]|nr:hypothetical protein [Acidimicrobiia bacterium]
MRDAVLIIGTALVGLGLILILWRELASAAERRKVGPLRDTFEVLLPVVATVALVAWVWVA